MCGCKRSEELEAFLGMLPSEAFQPDTDGRSIASCGTRDCIRYRAAERDVRSLGQLLPGMPFLINRHPRTQLPLRYSKSCNLFLFHRKAYRFVARFVCRTSLTCTEALCYCLIRN